MEDVGPADPRADVIMSDDKMDAKNGNFAGNLPDLVSFEQNTLREKVKVSDPILTKQSDHSKVELPDDEMSPSINGENGEDHEESPSAAESVKENDVKDECMDADRKDEWMDILGNGQLKKKVCNFVCLLLVLF
jgi:hypothetical protein